MVRCQALKEVTTMIIGFDLLVILDYKQYAYFSYKHTYKNTYMQTGHADTKM